MFISLVYFRERDRGKRCVHFLVYFRRASEGEGMGLVYAYSVAFCNVSVTLMRESTKM